MSSSRSLESPATVRAFEEGLELPPRNLLSGTPVRYLGLLAIGLALCAALSAAGSLPRAAMRVAGVAAGHGALLGTAVAWAAADTRPPWNPRPWLGLTVGLLALGAAGAVLDPRAAVLFAAMPVMLAVLAARGRLLALGLPGPVAAKTVALGVGIGLVLGAHLLIAAAETLHYRLRVDAAALAAMAYDVGANVPSAELFFRGALHNRAQRRWSFGAAASLATAASLARYLVDPLLPKTLEVLVGTVLYVTVLGFANAWLLSRTGSLGPGLLAALTVFIAYRLLAMV